MLKILHKGALLRMLYAFKKCLYDACKLLNSGSNAFHATACESPNGWSIPIRSTSFDYEVLPEELEIRS
jgi:hypothetical protein